MAFPYTVLIDGVPVQCETAEAALELIRTHGGTSGDKSSAAVYQPRAASGNTNGTRWNDQRITEFFKNIEGKQRKLVDALLEHDDRTDTQLLQLLNLSNGSALGGVFAGLWKNAKKVGADPGELYIKKAITIGDNKAYAYSLHEAFRTAAARRPASK
jgi:uncharacterized Ntn-hydrolase superfamily protein